LRRSIIQSEKGGEVMRVSTKKVVLCSVLSLLLGTAAVSIVSAGNMSAPPESAVTAPQEGHAEPIAPVAGGKVDVTEASFKCLHEMTKAGRMHVDNLLGDLDGTLAAANKLSGAYPPGSVVQLLPMEAMVKLEKGANPATNDWEFFVLDVSPEGSKIKQRGFETVGNRLGSCISCHRQESAPQADMICAAGHACPPVVFPGISSTEALISALQKMDQRCPQPELLTEEEKPVLKQFMDMLAAAAAGGGQ
jgi:hypothetical protein